MRWIEVSVKPGIQRFTASVKMSAQVRAARIPAGVIYALIGGGVAGAPIDTTAMVGDVVSYNFAAASGYRDVRVRVDGMPASAAGAIVADTVPHLITVTANRIPQLPAGGAQMLAAAQAVLTAADAPAAYQKYLDAVYAFSQTGGDAETVARGVRDVSALAFDPLRDDAAIARVDEALANWSFRYGPDPDDPGGAPILHPSDTSIMEGFRAAPGSLVASLEAENDTMETTTILYVNGVETDWTKADKTLEKLKVVVRGIPGFESPRILPRLVYNRNRAAHTVGADERRDRCMRSFHSSDIYGLNFKGDFLSSCTSDTTYRRMSDIDLVEAGRQWITRLLDLPTMEEDADRLKNQIDIHRRLGRHVIVVPHSQGNLLANQALEEVPYDPGVDSTCVGVVSLASPIDINWNVPAGHREQVIVDGDLVPTIGFNTSPRTSTLLSREVARTRDSLARRGLGFAAVYAIGEGLSTLHSVDESYLRYEAADSVKAGITRLYGRCSVASMTAEPVVLGIVGEVVSPSIEYRNAFGTIVRRGFPTQWSIADSSIVEQGVAGRFRGLLADSTRVTATRLGRTATSMLKFSAPTPFVGPVVGTWNGTWTSDTEDLSGPVSITIGNNRTGSALWTANGKSFAGVGEVFYTSDRVARVTAYSRNEFGVWTSRLFTVGVTGVNTADGASGNGTSTGGWSLILDRVVPEP